MRIHITALVSNVANFKCSECEACIYFSKFCRIDLGFLGDNQNMFGLSECKPVKSA